MSVPNKFILPFPRVIRIDPASQCNLKCSHCPTGTVDQERGIMKDDVFKRVLSAVKKNRKEIKVVVLYFGGEPFLNKNFFQMVKKISLVGDFIIKTVTNGTILNDDTILNIATSNLNLIEFSLDGNSPAENDFVRRDCDYKKVVKNIKRLMDFKNKIQSKTPEVVVSTTQFKTRETLENNQEPKVPDYLRKEFSGDYTLGESNFNANFAMRWPHMDVMNDIYEVGVGPLDNSTNNYCDHVFNTITIRSDGDVLACCYDLTSQYPMGNILKEDLLSIWNNNQYLDLRRSIEERSFNSLCSNCNVVQPSAYLMIKPKVLKQLRGKLPCVS